jgi:hypothetical protein
MGRILLGAMWEKNKRSLLVWEISQPEKGRDGTVYAAGTTAALDTGLGTPETAFIFKIDAL